MTHSSTRIEYIDALKGFAILCVVLGHIALGYLENNTIPEANVIFKAIHQLIYAFHMPLFMAISGFLYYKSYFDEHGFPKRNRVNIQVLNLFLVYILFSVGYGFINLIFGRFGTNDISIKDILFVGIKPIAVYWYLYILVILYLIFSIHGLLNLNKWTLLCCTVGLCILSALVKDELPFQLHLTIKRIEYYSLFFYLGISYRRYGRWIFDNIWLALAAFGVSTLLIVKFWQENVSALPIINSITAFGIILVVWYIFQHIKFFERCELLKMIGRYSLEIYVIHGVIVAACRAVVQKIELDNVYIIVIGSFIISTIIPILFSMLCKRLNIHGLLFKPVTYVMNIRGNKRGKL